MFDLQFDPEPLLYMRARRWIRAAWMRADDRPLPPAAEPEKTVALALWRSDGGPPQPIVGLAPVREECDRGPCPVARPEIGR